jgi:hypothetical protein
VNNNHKRGEVARGLAHITDTKAPDLTKYACGIQMLPKTRSSHIRMSAEQVVHLSLCWRYQNRQKLRRLENSWIFLLHQRDSHFRFPRASEAVDRQILIIWPGKYIEKVLRLRVWCGEVPKSYVIGSSGPVDPEPLLELKRALARILA